MWPPWRAAALTPLKRLKPSQQSIIIAELWDGGFGAFLPISLAPKPEVYNYYLILFEDVINSEMTEGSGPKDFSKFLEDAKNQAENYSSMQLQTDTAPLFEKMPLSKQIRKKDLIHSEDAG